MAMASTATSSSSTLRRRKKASPSSSFEESSQENRHQKSAHTGTTRRSTVILLISSLFVLSTCTKILLIPSYKSTDFDVHRHWKAVTRNLPVSEWYFDDQHVQTFHTLDYPPGFAWFEYLWSNLYLSIVNSLGLLIDDDRCLSLLPDTDNGVSVTCVTFMRSTVILSDVILWLGAGAIAWAATLGRLVGSVASSSSERPSPSLTAQGQIRVQARRCWTIFLLIVFHPGLLWLDHVHFQYNGMLLGILLLSLACLLQANNHSNNTNNAQTQTNNNTQKIAFHGYHLVAAVLFAFLLTLKHLYLILAPWYFCYLLQRYVLAAPTTTTTPSTTTDQLQWQGRVQRFCILGVVTLSTLILPMIPFLVASNDATTAPSRNAQQQLTQMAVRLFPFGRGLVHDYWAGNVWALHQAVNKVLAVVGDRLQLPEWLLLPDVSPGQCAVLLLLSLLPGCWQAVKAATERNNERLVLSVTYSALASFLTAYHVHEKAIVTSLLPLTVWAVGLATRQETTSSSGNNKKHPATAAAPLRLLTQTTAAAVLGLGPLLFRPVEMLLKVCTLTPYLAVLVHLCQCECEAQNMNMNNTIPPARKPLESLGSARKLLDVLGHICQPNQPEHKQQQQREAETMQSEGLQQTWLNFYWHHWLWWWASIAWIVPVWALVELIPVRVWGRYEFVPLAVTSVSVAVPLLISFAKITYRMVSIEAGSARPKDKE